MLACRAVSDAAQRLACFDREVARLSSALAAGDLVTLDREAIKKERRSLFGLPLPRIGLFGGDETPEQRELEATIVSAREIGNSRWRFALSTGANWETTESLGRQSDPRTNDRVKIKRGALGNYMMTIEGGPPRRVKRVE